jgi:hypothetical protein
MTRTPIPGLAEAVEKEASRRVAAFTPAPVEVAGVVLSPLTPAKLAVLESIASPVLAEEFPEPEHLAVFLWYCSEDFCVDLKARNRFLSRIADVDYYKALTEAQDWLASQFEDAPTTGSNDSKPSYVSWIASIVDAVASEYGWPEAEIMQIPFQRLTQYLRCIRMRHDPKAVMFNPSDKVKSEFMRRLNSQGNG